MNRKPALIALGLGIALTMSACVAPPPEVGPAPQIARNAALLDTQAAAVTADTFDKIAKADAALDASLFGDRVAGDALVVRTAQYKVAQTVAEERPDVLPSQMQATYVSAEEGWPRLLAGVSVQPGDNLTPVVSLWIQDDIASPYSLRAWAHMIPGASMPPMPSDVTGAAQLDLTVSTVSPTPQAVIEGYIEYLTAGKGSDLASNFAPDTYADRIFAAREVLNPAAAGAGGMYTDTITADLENVHVFATADGGALVFAPFDMVSAFSVVNAKVSVPAADQALVEGTLNDTVSHHYRDLVVFYIPGPGTGGLPAVVAADHHLIKVTAG